ncbi:MAG TPA: glucoamylase family protein [Chryseosolibacter sp.]
MIRKILLLLFLNACCAACDREETVAPLQLVQAFAGPDELDVSGQVTENISPDRTLSLIFSSAVNQSSALEAIHLKKGSLIVDAGITFPAGGRTVVIVPNEMLENNADYIIEVSADLQGDRGEEFTPIQIRFRTSLAPLTVTAVRVGGKDVTASDRVTDVPLNLGVTIDFSAAVNTSALEQAVTLAGPDLSALQFAWSDNNQSVDITTSDSLRDLMKYQMRILQTAKGSLGESFAGFSKTFYTKADATPKLPLITEDELLTVVQQQTFKYFWDFAHPASGMARERNTSGDVVTSGGSGFGIMVLIVAMQRGFIPRADGIDRIGRILTFLESADRFHGAWPHWMNGNTGHVEPFSANDNGGDLVETSYLIAGLLAFRQYLDPAVPSEKILADRINALWDTVEWDWYTRGGQHVLYWHWSPDKGWFMNHPIRGYNEALITYFLAAASRSHPIAAAVYHEGWAGSGAIANNKSFYGIPLPLGEDYGGPLFFAHYSFMGLDPNNLTDLYANYWTQNVNHSLINHAHAVVNPNNFVGYGDANWGFTASDDQNGYSAHSPVNDLGVVSPTAALSSMPYSPAESMKALKFFYYTLGDRLWGPSGFYDAFNITEGWTADSYLAIDQGPIIVMIENYRTGLLWNLFMSAPEVQVGMDKLGFTR